MRTRTAPEHQDVVHRRLELLRAELAQEWAGAGADEPAAAPEADDPSGDAWWSDHTVVPGADRLTALPTDGPVADVGAEPDDDPDGDPDDDRPATGESTRRLGAVPAVPVPGRHAARRRRSLDAAALVPAPVRGRIGVGPWQLVVVALAVAVGLAVTCWWMIRSDSSAAPALSPGAASPLVDLGQGSSSPSPTAPGATPGAVATASPTDLGPGASSTAPGSSASAGSGTMVTVDVEGKVHRPGIAVLPAGSRVIDAVDAAGGPRRRRDLAGLNLAAVLTDGQQIVVGATQAATPPVAGGSAEAGGASGAPTTLVNLNTASAEELESLPDVGPVTAQSIVDWRTQNGGFTSVDELLQVDGIGDKTLAKLTPYVTV